MGHGLSPGRGTEKQGGGLKYASVAPETTRACGLALILIPIKLSLASPCLAPFAEILPRRPLPRPLADTHGNTFRHSHNRYIRTALALYRPPLAANPPQPRPGHRPIARHHKLSQPLRGHWRACTPPRQTYGQGQRGVG